MSSMKLMTIKETLIRAKGRDLSDFEVSVIKNKARSMASENVIFDSLDDIQGLMKEAFLLVIDEDDNKAEAIFSAASIVNNDLQERWTRAATRARVPLEFWIDNLNKKHTKCQMTERGYRLLLDTAMETYPIITWKEKFRPILLPSEYRTMIEL